MNKGKYVIILFGCIACVFGYLFIFSLEEEEQKYSTINISGSQKDCNFDQLQNYAKVIVKAKVLDDISEKNAIIDSMRNFEIVDFATRRKIEIIETYKCQEKMDKITYILEPAALYGKQLLCFEGYVPMKQGNEYILYLGNNTKTGDYSVLCGNSGRVNEENLEELSDISNNTTEITVKSLIKYNSNFTNAKKKELLQSKVCLGYDNQAPTNETINGLGNNKLSLKYQNDKLYAWLEE